MFVAVVYKQHPYTDPQSHRPEKDWSCFLGYSKEAAVEAAIVAVNRWELLTNYDRDGKIKPPSGPYQILVGELTEEAKRFKYEVTKLESNDDRLDREYEDISF